MNDDRSEIINSTSVWDKRYEEGELACTKKAPSIDPIDYTQHPYLYKQAIARRITGDEDSTPLQMVAQKYLKTPAKRMLAVGSGLAIVEESLVRDGHVEKLIAFEASPVAVETARERIRSSGLENRIEMRCGDVLNANFSENEFDVVFVQAAIHHFYNIEEMFQFFHFVLKPDGLIIYDEYVGPDHHLYEPDVMDLMDEVNNCLSSCYRWDVLRNEFRDEVPRATLEWMLEMDPSEGVHSTKILPLTYKFFDVEFRRDYGGTFMRPFFVGILPNFDFEDEKDRTVANLIVLIEDLLVRNGVIPSYHTVVVGRRRNFPLEDLTDEAVKRINYSDWTGLERFGSLTAMPVIDRFTPANFSDTNWNNGVGTFGGAVIFLAATRRAKHKLVEGQKVVFSNNEQRTILNTTEEGGSIKITFSGDALDPETAGYPNKFKLL